MIGTIGTPRVITNEDLESFMRMYKEDEKCEHLHISVSSFDGKISASCVMCGQNLKNIRIPCLDYGEAAKLLRKIRYSTDGYEEYEEVHNTFVLMED